MHSVVTPTIVKLNCGPTIVIEEEVTIRVLRSYATEYSYELPRLSSQ